MQEQKVKDTNLGVNFDTILPALFEGLIENHHPLSFIAQQGIKDLLQTNVTSMMNQMAKAKVRPILRQVMFAVRPCFEGTLQATYKAALGAIRYTGLSEGTYLNASVKS